MVIWGSNVWMRLLNWVPQIIDCFSAILVGSLATYCLLDQGQSIYLSHIPFFTLIYFVSGYAVKLYGSWRGTRLGELMVCLLLAWLLSGVLISFAVIMMSSIMSFSRIWLLVWMIGGFILSGIFRWFAYRVADSLRTQGMNHKRVLLIGMPLSVERIHQKMQSSGRFGFSFVPDFILSSSVDEQVLTLDFDESALYEHLNQYIQSLDEIWIVLPLSESSRVKRIHELLLSYSVNIRFFPDLSDFRLFNHSVSHIGSLYAVNLSKTPFEGGSRLIKSLEDRVFGTLFFVLFLPLMVVIALAIRFSSHGPIVFKQHRQGLDGKVFKIYKFRTMYHEGRSEACFRQAVPGDERITPLGRILRQTSLDELPQFFNVLQGRMSIVGPRPHVPEQNSYFSKVIEAYMQRHRVKPGITGWAQVNGLRGITDTDDAMRKRVEYDFYYINNWSILFDVKIMVLTVVNGFVNRNP